jgi:hypothetical protein
MLSILLGMDESERNAANISQKIFKSVWPNLSKLFWSFAG